jgi:hypothetical protein
MKASHIILTLLLAGSLFEACRPDDFAPVGTPNDNLAAISGAWKLVRVTQTDAEAQRKGFPYKVLDVTDLFPYTTLQMTFNLTNGAPGTFTINKGTAPAITSLSSGNWTVDDVKAPGVITLTSGATSEKMTLGSYPNAVNGNLKVRVNRNDQESNRLLIVYDYEFSR